MACRGLRALAAAGLLALTLPQAALAKLETAPAYAWGNTAFINPNKDDKYFVSNELVSDRLVLGLVDGVVSASRGYAEVEQILSDAIAQERPEVVLVFEDGAGAGRGAEPRAATDALTLAQAADRAVFLPYVQGHGAKSIGQIVANMGAGAQGTFSVGCGERAGTALGGLEDVPSALEAARAGGEPTPLVVVCGGPALTLDAAVAQVAGSKHVVFYRAVPGPRRALKGAQDERECGDKCQAQALFFEGVVVVILVLLAILSGVGLLTSLQAPTRWEQREHGD
ncbi:unnamed protein product [Pedinophyceae sp. YPF-701]|nr:unnamed protein product [Pedinophyceae sp. YPF-701]